MSRTAIRYQNAPRNPPHGQSGGGSPGTLIRQIVQYEWLPIQCAHCQMMGHTEAECRKKTGIRQEWRRVVRDTAPFSHTARTDAAQSPTKAAKMQHEQTVTVTIQPEHPVNDNVQDVQPAQPHQNMDNSPSASANTQSPDRASKIDQSDADGFTIVRRKQSSRPNTRSQMLP
ncbi:hypothetical protein Cgig2_029024 [Carnegiea gigantea]|uniref:Uncharacterized protein n=1 Tax=Carnegiea gigantea TaxID=171969 RepID=A0A9Q1GQM3_9CARY|nr:hypothetical protein Cgig2_029024 [Carnegiea gigantea]